MNKNKWLMMGMLATLLAFGLALSGCGFTADSDDDGDNNGGKQGKLTITGLDAKYNGKFAMATGQSATEDIRCGNPSPAFPVLAAVEISEGKVVLPVYSVTTGRLYIGSDSITFELTIYSDKGAGAGTKVASGTHTVTFKDGVVTATGITIDASAATS